MGITQDQWGQYHRDGFLKIGKQSEQGELEALQTRIDEIMLGKADLDYDRLMMQLDSSSGKYGDVPGGGKGLQEPSLNYRKIQGLEFDSLFLRYMQKQIFEEICAYIYGAHNSTACFRAMFMNKPAQLGTDLPWHQDGGGSWHIDRDPLVTVWTALDPATVENGCVQVVPGTHQLGILSEQGHTITPELETRLCPEESIVDLEVEPGEVVVLHNWLLHRSGVNRSNVSRRAFSACYIDARTKHDGGNQYSLIFGAGAMAPEELAQAI
jgi:ectoine hydroxylase-related dioxygenase (phytanoyl-CoA dioxygenase family)